MTKDLDKKVAYAMELHYERGFIDGMQKQMQSSVDKAVNRMAQTELCKYGLEPKSCTSNPMDCQCAIDASLAQTQEPVPPPWWPAVENILNEYGLQAIDFVADFKQALAQTQEPWCMKMNDCKTKCEDCPDEPPQRTWVDLTDEEVSEVFGGDIHAEHSGELRFVRAIEAKLKQKNT